MSSRNPAENDVITLTRSRELRFVKELGEGACGKTVLLHDDVIDERFVCKKYKPFDATERLALYEAFVREAKLLVTVHGVLQ